MDRACRQTIRNHEDGFVLSLRQRRCGAIIQPPPKIRPLQVRLPIERAAVDDARVETRKSAGEALGLEFPVHGVARPGMRQLKLEQRARGECRPTSSEENARRSACAQARERIRPLLLRDGSRSRGLRAARIGQGGAPIAALARPLESLRSRSEACRTSV